MKKKLDSMEAILVACKECNIFSLSTDFRNERLSREEAHKALKILKDSHKEELLEQYNKENEKNELPNFSELYCNIENECIEFREKYMDYYIEKFGSFECSFIADHVGEDTLYEDPIELFWAFYNTLGMDLDGKIKLETLLSSNYKINPTDILDEEAYVLLKPWLIKYEISFITHCTEGRLAKTFYFELNDETKKWLLQFTSDFEIKGDLQDLALYKGNKLLFSSCTHEKQHEKYL